MPWHVLGVVFLHHSNAKWDKWGLTDGSDPLPQCHRAGKHLPHVIPIAREGGPAHDFGSRVYTYISAKLESILRLDAAEAANDGLLEFEMSSIANVR
jgi:hypothetical protein